MLIAGDIGGTKTLLGLFELRRPRPHALATRSYPTAEFASFTAILDAFRREIPHAVHVGAAALGVAGPVIGGEQATLTNVPWGISAAEIAARLGAVHVQLLNDLEAMAASIEVLRDDELEVLQAGRPDPGGNAVVIAAGTGLGEAYLHRVHGRLLPVPSEGGHADFAPRTDAEIELVRMLRARHGRAEVEQVLSGPGLINLHRLTHGTAPCAAAVNLDLPHDAPAAISLAAVKGTCAACMEALELFVDAYGAEAGNLALRGVATAGVYIGGGIAPKILPLLRKGYFIRAFGAKPPMTELLSGIPVRVILNTDAGLLGAAVTAQELVSRSSSG